MNRPASMIKALASGMAALSPNCREAARLQSEALDRKLPPLKRTGLRIHLVLCRWCRRYGKQIKFLRSAAKEHSEQGHFLPEQKLSSEARERIRRAVAAGKK